MSFEMLSDELIENYSRFERALRLALLRASIEAQFAQLFASDEAVVDAFGK